ncbi:hypothetical protein RHMOL_Rhmol06G0125500 [Rhododendron molle]|uniref:Uncharacterized protein n=1 Tax=Rhododendron molle TaxID=49168 RepID=A0ACC0NBG3_RHOML|nr:hypothetical protein RHMOL_Rhmol06G0125500 [Rhododendron molle]
MVDSAGGEVRRFWVPEMRIEKESSEPYVRDEVVAAIAGSEMPSCGVGSSSSLEPKGLG